MLGPRLGAGKSVGDSDRNLGILTKAISKQRVKCPVQGDIHRAVRSQVRGLARQKKKQNTSVLWGESCE